MQTEPRPHLCSRQGLAFPESGGAQPTLPPLLRAAWCSQALLPTQARCFSIALRTSTHHTQADPSGAPALPSLKKEAHRMAKSRRQANRHPDTHKTLESRGRRGRLLGRFCPGLTQQGCPLPSQAMA